MKVNWPRHVLQPQVFLGLIRIHNSGQNASVYKIKEVYTWVSESQDASERATYLEGL